jgi:hypothetical protein
MSGLAGWDWCVIAVYTPVRYVSWSGAGFPWGAVHAEGRRGGVPWRGTGCVKLRGGCAGPGQPGTGMGLPVRAQWVKSLPRLWTWPRSLSSAWIASVPR